jgi:predicted transcriptional regulator
MATMTLSLPDELKDKMDKIDWINWSSVARHAFVQKIEDYKKMQQIKKVREISQIPEDYVEMDEAIAKEAVDSLDKGQKSSNQKRKNL